MASLTIKKGSSRWIACFTDATGAQRQRSTGIANEGTPAERAEARRKALTVAQEMEATARGDRTEAQVRRALTDLYNTINPERRLEWSTVRAFFAEYLDRVKRQKKGKTFTRYEKVLGRFLTHLGPKADAQLGEVHAGDVQGFIHASMAAGKKAGTIRLETKILNAVFTYANRRGAITSNPVAAGEVPNRKSASKRPLTAEQLRAVVKATEPERWESGDRITPRLGDWRTAILFAAYVGLRLGDACSVQWKNVDLQQKTATLKPEKTRDGENEIEITVPLHRTLEARLLELEAPDDPAAFITPNLAGVSIGGRGGLSRQFQRIMAVAGIENEKLAERAEGSEGRSISAYGFHSIRHYYVTTLANAGVAQDVRMALAGHSSAKTNELYTHRGVEILRKAVEKLPGI